MRKQRKGQDTQEPVSQRDTELLNDLVRQEPPSQSLGADFLFSAVTMIEVVELSTQEPPSTLSDGQGAATYVPAPQEPSTQRVDACQDLGTTQGTFSDSILSEFTFSAFTDGMTVDSPPKQGTPIHMTSVNFSQPPLLSVGQRELNLSCEAVRKELDKNKNEC